MDDGRLQLVELSPIDPWLADPRQPLELQEGEVKVCFLYYVLCFFKYDFLLTGKKPVQRLKYAYDLC